MAKFQESNWPLGKHLQQIISYQLAEVWKQKNFLIFLLRMKALRRVGSQSLNRYLFFQGSPTDYGWDETIVFFNETKNFTYDEPKDLVDLTSRVICLPENYGNYSGQPIQESKLRITHPANFDLWNKMGSENYYDKKKDWASQILENGIREFAQWPTSVGWLSTRHTIY